MKIFLISGVISAGVSILCLGARHFAAMARPLPNLALGIAGCLLAYGLACAVFLRGRKGLRQNVLPTES
jgi:hypothetical protein